MDLTLVTGRVGRPSELRPQDTTCSLSSPYKTDSSILRPPVRPPLLDSVPSLRPILDFDYLPSMSLHSLKKGS